MVVARCCFAGLVLLMACGLVNAHEVDQYVLPDCEQFEDLGDYWNEIFETAVSEGLCSLNRDIELANSIPFPPIRDLMLAKYHSPGTVAWRVRKHLPIGLLAIAETELKLATGDIPRKHCDRVQSFRASTFSTAFNHFPLLPDPRQLGRMTFMRSSLVKVHDTYMGTDKIGHFIGHGYQYFLAYRTSRHLGNSRKKAVRHAVNVGTFGPVSENMFVGVIPTGVFSNADQAANYVGMKFFINLTEPVQLKGCIHPPMLVRDGDYWAKRDGLDAQYFAAFVSEHFDEVLNPSVYDVSMRSQVRDKVRKEAGKLLDWYAGDDPAKRNRAYFDGILERCKKYFGEDYGYSGDYDELVAMGDICFCGQAETVESPSPFRLAATAKKSQPSFSVKVSTPLIHQVGESEGYEVVVQSRLGEDVENINVVAEIPAGIHVTTLAQPARFDRATNTLAWQVSTFEAGTQRKFLFIARAVKKGIFSPKVLVNDASQKFAATTYGVNVFSSASDLVEGNQSGSGVHSKGSGDARTSTLEVAVFGPAKHHLGESKTYEIAVFNPSETDIENAAIALELPNGLRVTKLNQPAELDARAGRLTWRLPYVEAGIEYVLRLTASAVAEGSYEPRIVVLDGDSPVSVATLRATTLADLPASRVAEGGTTTKADVPRRIR